MGITALAAGTLVGDYEIERKLAEGGMGAVYTAVHPVIGKKVAVKVMSANWCSDESVVARFVQEAQAVNHIGHPNIVDIFAHGSLDDGRSYLVMEWLNGTSLLDRIAKGPVPLVDVVAILDQVASAVEAAHAKGVVHRDLKPENVMLVDETEDRSVVKLVDFGIAKLANPNDTGYIARTKTGLVMGTPGYISPEQARGKDVDERTDCYALGCLAYELLTGVLPYSADNSVDVVVKHLQEPIPRAKDRRPDTPDLLDRVVAALMAKRADERASLADFRAVLAEVALTRSGRGEGSRYSSPLFARMTTPLPDWVRAEGSSPFDATDGAVAAVSTTEVSSIPTVLVEDGPTPRTSRKFIWLAGSLLAAAGLFAWFLMQARGPVVSTEQPAVEQPAVEQPAVVPEPEVPATPATGELVIEVNVSGARIEVDGTLLAAGAARAVLPNVEEGSHSVRVTAEGYTDFKQTVDIAAGGDFTVRAALEPVPAARDSAHAQKSSSRSRRAASSRRSAKHKENKAKAPTDINTKAKQYKGPDYTMDPFAQ